VEKCCKNNSKPHIAQRFVAKAIGDLVFFAISAVIFTPKLGKNDSSPEIRGFQPGTTAFI